MKRVSSSVKLMIGFVLILAGSARAQPFCAPLAGQPVATVKGKISRVRLSPREGLPYVEVEVTGNTIRVVLGPVWYLMEENFNPKAGSEMEVKGYRLGDDLVAAQVFLLAEHKSVKLRDESGQPIWMHCRHRRGRL